MSRTGQPFRFSMLDRIARWWLIRRGLLIDLQPRETKLERT